MAYFDYSPVQVQPSGLSRVADALSGGLDEISARRRQQMLDDLAKQKAEREDARQQAAQAFMEQQGRTAAASQQRLQGQQDITSEQQQADRRKQTVMDIGKAQGAGGFGVARGIANASQFVNPKTGRLEGVGYEPIPGAPDPGAAPQDSGEAPSPGGLDAVDSQVAQHDQASQAFQASQKDPRFNLSFPGGQSVEISGREQQQAADAERKDKARALLQSMPPNTPPEVLRAVAIQAGLIGAGTSNADNAPITNANAAVQAQGGRMELAGVNNAAKLEQTKASRMGKGLGAAGKNAPTTDAEATLAGMAANPATSAEDLRKFAGQNAIHFDRAEKIITNAHSQESTTGAQTKDAQQASMGLRAVQAIKASGYKPTHDDIQKWIDNQRQVENARGWSKSGLIGSMAAGLGQGSGAMAQSEFEGMSPAAKDYFSNVDRYMEVTGRKQSGSAINMGEWDKFYGQFGPSSPGGLDAAEQSFRDQMASTGKAGARIQQGAAASARAAGGADKLSLAREALADPAAPERVKAQARKILAGAR